MSQAVPDRATALPIAEPPPEFYCAEVWGGNRAVNAAIQLPGLRGWLYSRPCAGGRGGDIHYTSICGSGLLSRVCLADVAGHGEAVATIGDEIHDLLRRYMNTLDDRKVLQTLNRRLLRSDFACVTTVASVSYFPPIRRLSLSYAGHPPAWLCRRAEDRWQPLLPPSREHRMDGLLDLPLASDADTRFTRRKETVNPGDRLLLVTDGVLETFSPQGVPFGPERLAGVLREQHAASEEQLVRAILAALSAHAEADRLTHDDVTMLAVRFEPGPRAFGLWHGLRRRLFPRPARRRPATA